MRSKPCGWNACLAAVLFLGGLTVIGPLAVMAAPGLVRASKSGLPYPAGGDVWVDLQGTATAPLPGVPLDGIRKLQVLVIRPRGDQLTWEQFGQVYVDHGLLEPRPKAGMSLLDAPNVELAVPGAVLNHEETNLYPTRAGQRLVLGLVRNLRTGHQLAYAVAIDGNLDNAQAIAYGKYVAKLLSGAAQVARSAPPVPPLAQPDGPVARLQGVHLQQLLNNLRQAPLLAPRLKRMAEVVIPQASAITLSKWRTPTPMADQAFFTFYLQAAANLGWGAPVIQDATHAGRPTLLFERPNNSGVVMVRAQPTPQNPLEPRAFPSTTIFILVMEGKIDVGALRVK